MNVVQTEFGQNVSFEMRTFRFIIAGSSATEAQDQTIDCNLHLEPVDDVSSTQPDDCSCHTETDCLNQGFYYVYSVLNMANTIWTHLKIESIIKNQILRLEIWRAIPNPYTSQNLQPKPRWFFHRKIIIIFL